MWPMKISASLILPINSMAAFELGGVFWSDVYLLGFGACTGACSMLSLDAGGGPALSSPSGSLKALSFKCSGTCDAYAPILDNYSIESGFDHSPF